MTRHQVFLYMPRSLQCRTCERLGHVAGACSFLETCGRCGSDHKTIKCTSQERQCMHCFGEHDPTYKDCPRLRKKLKIGQRLARDSSTHKEAAKLVRVMYRAPLKYLLSPDDEKKTRDENWRIIKKCWKRGHEVTVKAFDVMKSAPRGCGAYNI